MDQIDVQVLELQEVEVQMMRCGEEGWASCCSCCCCCSCGGEDCPGISDAG